jgi:hypothetical protein
MSAASLTYIGLKFTPLLGKNRQIWRRHALFA